MPVRQGGNGKGWKRGVERGRVVKKEDNECEKDVGKGGGDRQIDKIRQDKARQNKTRQGKIRQLYTCGQSSCIDQGEHSSYDGTRSGGAGHRV